MSSLQISSTCLPHDAASATPGAGSGDRASRVLIVDDEAAIRFLLQDTLMEHGLEVHAAASFEEAVHELESALFDAVIVDIGLGESQSGLDLLQVLRRTQPFTQAIVVTGMASTDSVLQALKAGAYDLLTKPFNLAEIQKAVNNAVEKKAMLEENARLLRELRAERDLLEIRVQDATANLETKVQTLRSLNQQLSTIFEMSRARTIEASTQKVLEHIISLLGEILVFEDAFCVVLDLRAGEINLKHSTSPRAARLAEHMAGLLAEHQGPLAKLVEEAEPGAVDAALKEALLGMLPGVIDSRHSILMPLYAPQALLGIFGAVEIHQPTNLSDAEERMMAFAISHFLAALEQRNFLNRTTQLESFGELVSEIAHDLRHPMTSLRGATKILEDKWDDPAKRVRCTGQIRTDMSRMESLVAELVNFFNPRDLNMVLTDIHELLAKTLEVSHFLLDQKSIRVITEFAAEPPLILGLARNLVEAFVNLVSNATQAMETGGTLTVSTTSELTETDQKRLKAESKRPEEFLRVTISDTGCGISAENLNRIFKRFFTTRAEGHGLGLSAVNRIIRKNLGTIHVQSEPGRGSAFTVYLPKA